MAKKFCPQCGTERQSNEKFCRKCGYNFNSSKPNNHQRTEAQTTRNAQKSSPRQWSKGKKIGVISGIVLAVALIIFYIWGNDYYSQTKQLTRISEVMSSTKEDASKIITSSDSNLKVTKASVEPTQKYFSENKSELNTMITTVSTGASYHGINLVQDGHYWLIFPKYKLNVEPAYGTVETNHKNSKVYIDGKNVGTAKGSDGEYTLNFGPYFPGTHTFQVKTTVNGRKLATNKDTDNIWSKGNNEEMTITTASFKVQTIPGATVYLDGENQGKTNGDGEMDFKQYPITEGLKLQVEANVNGKKIRSKNLNVYDYVENEGEKTLSPKFAGTASEETVQELLSDAFQPYQAASDDNANIFQNQESNGDFKDIKKMFDGFNKDDNNLSISTDVTVKSVLPAGDNKTDVVFDVKYAFDRIDDKKIVQVMEYTGAVIEKNPDYEKNNSAREYMIDTIGKGKLIKNDTLSSDD
ncbi:zinc ribbon domain-containing protein [Ligilactobacillus cholophilus]|uniref:zinc ribbon domain-containing protein n=1 Tax=Ligilactobacillus cholophilus TaxID=3050131 RepID=UPI0025AF5189|nr:zinc-ribbon domain-containing protein [Ligilactobacillus cholophilus]